MNELDPKEKYDPTFLFIRADERMEAVEMVQHDIQIQFRDHKNEVSERFRDLVTRLDGLVERMDNQVSKTGHRNSDEIKALNTKQEKIDTQLFDKDTGLISQFVSARRAMYGILTTGFVAFIAWLWQHFWK